MNVPDWWTLVLLGLASYRTYRLIAKDVLLDIPRGWLVGLGGWKEGQPVPRGYRTGLAEFLVCPWCIGFWVGFAWWFAWLHDHRAALVAATPFAISTVVGLLAQLDREE
jgi:hypothetical protein